MKKLIKYDIRGPIDIYFDVSPENAQLLRVKRKSNFSGNVGFMDLPVTEQQLRQWLGNSDHQGESIQYVMPHLTSEQREFLISGCTPVEWEDMTKDEK